MSLTNCYNCKKEVSDKDKICPHCGVKHPAISPKQLKIVLFAVVSVLFLLFTVFIVDEEKDIQKTTQQIQQVQVIQQKVLIPTNLSAADKVKFLNRLTAIVSEIKQRGEVINNVGSTTTSLFKANWNRKTQQWRGEIETEIPFLNYKAPFCKYAFISTGVVLSRLISNGVGYVFQTDAQTVETNKTLLLRDLNYAEGEIARCFEKMK